MGKLMERCKALRNDTTRHYGCSQAVFLPVAEAMGLDPETAYKIAENFRAGMFTGGPCGAVTGALMALGLAGATNKQAVELQNRVKANHAMDIGCEVLLKRWFDAGNKEKKPHCDEMCYECMAIVEEMLPELK